MQVQLQISIVECLLTDLAPGFEKYGPARFGVAQCLPNRQFEQIVLNWAVDLAEQAKLPFSAYQTGLLRQPDVQLSPRQRLEFSP
ncbi:hypothetical protein BST26_20130 [Mycolicibacterium insubricum]|uniref:Uncharacterized protein n=1 Tax=Mycolicibacterium insubricum TaxID=444597 RepID=A0A1X0CWB7_9MYCO|nr:hypothetical protein BST26_20130 [Mycolicibacterium insubricum]